MQVEVRDAEAHDGEVDPRRVTHETQRRREPARRVHHRSGLVTRQVRELVDVSARHDEQVPEVVGATGLLGRDVKGGDQLVFGEESPGKVDLPRELLADEAVRVREGSLLAPLTDRDREVLAGYARIAFDVPAR